MIKLALWGGRTRAPAIAPDGKVWFVGQQPAQDAPKVVEAERVKDSLFVLRGGGGNTAVKERTPKPVGPGPRTSPAT